MEVIKVDTRSFDYSSYKAYIGAMLGKRPWGYNPGTLQKG